MSRDPMTEDDLADLSDDEIMGMASAPVMEEVPAEGASTTDEAEDDQTENNAEGEAAQDDALDTAADDQDDADLAQDTDGEPKTETPDADAEIADQDDAAVEKQTTSKKPVKAAEAKQEPEPKADDKPADETPKAAAPIDYKAAYDAVMAPFMANGKEVKLESLDEAVRLMQMGANYTKKMQGLAPNLRIVKMLEKNGLLDEQKLNRLIDIENKNPAAIKQLIKDSGVDPLDIDITEDSGYKPGNHQISDVEMRFSNTVEEVISDPIGKELINTIHRTWDMQSKDALWSDPDILHILTQQRKNGIFAKINAEVDRRKTLGYVQQDTPFLEAYQKVGLEMDKQGLLKPETTPKTPAQPGAQSQPNVPDQGRKVLDQRTGLKKPGTTVANNDKARAASSTKGGPVKGAVDFNPLAMSDEEFEKTAAIAKRL